MNTALFHWESSGCQAFIVPACITGPTVSLSFYQSSMSQFSYHFAKMHNAIAVLTLPNCCFRSHGPSQASALEKKSAYAAPPLPLHNLPKSTSFQTLPAANIPQSQTVSASAMSGIPSQSPRQSPRPSPRRVKHVWDAEPSLVSILSQSTPDRSANRLLRILMASCSVYTYLFRTVFTCCSIYTSWVC